eukprot:m51a1_g10769 hypothetical protein (394) ;mRNA; r:38729-40048
MQQSPWSVALLDVVCPDGVPVYVVVATDGPDHRVLRKTYPDMLALSRANAAAGAPVLPRLPGKDLGRAPVEALLRWLPARPDAFLRRGLCAVPLPCRLPPAPPALAALAPDAEQALRTLACVQVAAEASDDPLAAIDRCLPSAAAAERSLREAAAGAKRALESSGGDHADDAGGAEQVALWASAACCAAEGARALLEKLRDEEQRLVRAAPGQGAAVLRPLEESAATVEAALAAHPAERESVVAYERGVHPLAGLADALTEEADARGAAGEVVAVNALSRLAERVRQRLTEMSRRDDFNPRRVAEALRRRIGRLRSRTVADNGDVPDSASDIAADVRRFQASIEEEKAAGFPVTEELVIEALALSRLAEALALELSGSAAPPMPQGSVALAPL